MDNTHCTPCAWVVIKLIFRVLVWYQSCKEISAKWCEVRGLLLELYLSKRSNTTETRFVLCGWWDSFRMSGSKLFIVGYSAIDLVLVGAVLFGSSCCINGKSDDADVRRLSDDNVAKCQGYL